MINNTFILKFVATWRKVIKPRRHCKFIYYKDSFRRSPITHSTWLK